MEFSTPPAGLAGWMICLGCLLWITNSAIRLVTSARGASPQPPNDILGVKVEHIDRRVTVLEKMPRPECKCDSNEISRRLAVLEENGETRTVEIYEKIDEVRKELNRKVDDLAASFEQFPDRMLAMLKNIKELSHKL